jgi:sugar lactone lactonase YvrE
MNCEVLSEASCLLGECPVWDHHAKKIYWIDIFKGDIHRLDPVSKQYERLSTGKVMGSIALRKNGGIIAAIERSFATIDYATSEIQVIAPVEPGPAFNNNRFNDGKCDPAGRFWAGTMSTEGASGAGSLYCLDTDLSVQTRLRNITCSNGLAWSPDHNILYYIDTARRNVAAFNYNLVDGAIKNGRIVISIPEVMGYPDGMTIDAEGMLWIAMWGGSQVVRYNPHSGKELCRIALPVSLVTSCTFGGDSLEDLYVTSATTGLSSAALAEQPLAGSLFVIPSTGYKGTSVFEFGR